MVIGFAGKLRSAAGSPELPVAIAASLFDHRAKSEIRTLKHSCLIFKPIRRTSINHGLQKLLGREAGETRAAVPLQQLEVNFGSNFRVLVAEDNACNQLLIRKLLEKLLLSVDLVENGYDAVEASKKGTYDAIFMDCQMPIMDGFEATRRIRNLEPDGRRVPIIAMTALAQEADVEQCLASGMDDYLPKPIDFQQVISVLQRLFEPPR